MRDRSRWRCLDDRFTLIEVMVVVIIIGILIAIALPTYLGAKGRAEDRSARANLRTALEAAKVFYTAQRNYTGFDPTIALTQESSINWEPSGYASTSLAVYIDCAGGGSSPIPGCGPPEFATNSAVDPHRLERVREGLLPGDG